METTRHCPYCAEEIAGEAIRCRHCRSRLVDLDPGHWHRNHPDRRVAGVAAATARGLAVPPGWVRIGFVALTFVHLIGPLVYGALWLLLPAGPDDESPAEQWLGRARATLRTWRLGDRHAVKPGPT
jgi:phage shock protein PspC (stress-responsive transcriptional regulator)